MRKAKLLTLPGRDPAELKPQAELAKTLSKGLRILKEERKRILGELISRAGLPHDEAELVRKVFED